MKHTSQPILCLNCGQSIYINKYRLQKTSNHFCSIKCRDIYNRQITHKITHCEICGKSFECVNSSKQRFCSTECQHKWQKTQTGALNTHYHNTDCVCETCGTTFHIRPYKLNNQQHHFCSKECRQKWYADYWCLQDSWKDFSRQKIIETLSSGKMSSINSKPQQIIDNLLFQKNIKFEREKNVGKYCVDIYLTNYNLMIEVNGDYWHSNPLRFKDTSDKQDSIIKRDALKNIHIKNVFNISVLYLWERDIVKHVELCEKLIDAYINNNGVLPNYNSFNYKMEDGKIILNSDIVLSYQEQQILLLS